MKMSIEKLLEKYYEGETSVEEERELKRFFREESVPKDLESHAAQFGYFAAAREEYPSLTFTGALAARLDPPQQGPVRRFTSWIVQIAAGLALLLVGFAGGYVLQKGSDRSGDRIAGSADEVPRHAIKNALAFEKMASTSASERIQAVNQSYELTNVDTETTQLLINTLNFDPNINVRLAACQALVHFENEPQVNEALIHSLSIQTDPNIQILLIEALVAIREKRASEQFQQLARNGKNMEVVRLRAEQGIGELSNTHVQSL
ncbi:HEAT repeat domain-containing protein [Dyadobacter sp. CY343]|uniref:HEAT repeat domain-containing protein n=1 Tax=Dyadobacter sp. CY343 TaxID=2907299 RepID=UPI001F1D0080|nr:HEAT repeat domain-containing protein [Dyadobacter sp. CY343]MCE7062017.1 HEAT repeat domain-containing protein [Dyadobacter sp. CY343]